MTEQTVKVLNTALVCEHWARFDPPAHYGDTVWCHACGQYREVVGGVLRYRKPADRKEFRYVAECSHGDFRRKEWEKKDAEIQGDSHVLRTGHVVTVRDVEGRTVTSITSDRIIRSPVTGT